MRRKLRLKRRIKEILKKVGITILIVGVDLILYHYLSIVGEFQGTTSWCSAFLVVGWSWITMATVPLLMFVWE